MKKGILVLSLVGFAVIVGGFVFKEAGTQEYVLSSQAQLPVKIPAVLQVEQESFWAEIPEGSTAYDLMVLVSKQSDFTFHGRNFPGLGFFVDEIQEKKENQKEGIHWIYSINGKVAIVGVSSYIIQPNDVISWNYENSDY